MKVLAAGCGAGEDRIGIARLIREAVVVAVSENQVQFELLALSNCGSCPGGMFCPSSKLRAAQILALDRDGETRWTLGDRAQLQIRVQAASSAVWKLFAWPLLSLLLAAALTSIVVPGRYQDLAIMAAATLAALIALWLARSSLSDHCLAISAVSLEDTARPSPGA